MDTFYRWTETSLLAIGFTLGLGCAVLSASPTPAILNGVRSDWLPMLTVVADRETDPTP